MTKIYLKKTKTALKVLIFSMLLFAFKVSAQCPSGNVGFSTQAEVDQLIIDYPNCTQIAGELFIGVSDGSSDITNLAPLANLTSITGNLSINNNPNLANVNGLNNITSVGGFVQFYGNQNLTNINLTGLVSINSNVNIDTNSELTSLTLTSLTTIGGYFIIKNNDALTNLNGLSSLTNIGADIDIEENTLLDNISALQNTTFNPLDGYGLTLVNNPALTVCNLPNFCTYLANPSSTHPRNISGNLTNCLDEEAVITACATMSVEDITKTNISVYPNPANEMLYFSEEVSNVSITDISGRVVEHFSSQGASINVAELSKGIYILSATTQEGTVFTKKIIKE